MTRQRQPWRLLLIGFAQQFAAVVGAAIVAFSPTSVPDIPPSRRVELAPQARLKRVEHLAPRFFREVLSLDPEDCLVTDESDLSDFATATASREERRAEVEGFLSRMCAHYLVDGRGAPSTRIVDLLELLEAHGILE